MRKKMLAAALALAAAAPLAAAPRTLSLCVAQVGVEPSLAANRDKAVRYIRQASARGCRAVAFPEGYLREQAQEGPQVVDAALDRIARAADEGNIYVILGGHSKPDPAFKAHNWMVVFDPDGQRIFRYEKLYDKRDAKMPDVFYIDGVPCSAFICADRWLRGLEELPVMKGSRVLFELSRNFAMEWVEPLGWYWYVPRALRNQVFVVLANSANHPSWDDPKHGPHHGHSAVIGPDGTLLAGAHDASERLVAATIDVEKATGGEARARFSHPVFEPFWKTGLQIMAGEKKAIEPVRPYLSPEIDITIAGAQMASSRRIEDNVARMRRMVRDAAAGGADLVVFPELAATGALEEDIRAATAEQLQAAVDRMRQAAKEHGMHVVFGIPHRRGGAIMNSAYALGPDGAVLTRYDQTVVDRPALFTAGTDPKSMWFRVKGVPAVVTIGKDALWNEIAELAAHAGAQIHVTIHHDLGRGKAADLRRMQIWAAMASYKTFTPAVNAAYPAGLEHPSAPAGGGSAIWDDLSGQREVRKALDTGQPNPDPSVKIFSPWSANCVVQAGEGEQIIYATRRVNARNPYRQPNFNPQMRPWYDFGGQLISPGPQFQLRSRP